MIQCSHGNPASSCPTCNEAQHGDFVRNANAKGRERKHVYLRALLKVERGNVSLHGVCCMSEQHPRTPGLDFVWATIAEADAETVERGIEMLKRSLVPAVADLMRTARRS